MRKGIVPSVSEIDIFKIQERVIADIVQSTEEQVVVEAAPMQRDPIQNIVVTALRSLIRNPSLKWRQIMDMMKFVDQPLPSVHIKTLRDAYGTYSSGGNPSGLIKAIAPIQTEKGLVDVHEQEERADVLRRDDLYPVCFEYIWL